MRAFFGLLGLGGLFCGWWFGAAYLLRAAPAPLSERGIQVQSVEVAGFPGTFAVRLDRPALPARGWRADWAALSLPSYWPFAATGTLSGQQGFARRGATWQMDGADMPFQLEFSPAQELTRATLSARDMSVTGATNLELDGLTLTLARNDMAHGYRLALEMAGLAIPFLGGTLDNASLHATLRYTAPLRLTTQGALAEIALEEMRLVSGPSQGAITGRLARQDDGLWTGDLVLTLTNWQPVLAGLQQGGGLPPDQAPLVMMMVQSMSTGDTLTLPLSVNGSILSLGPLPLLDLRRL